MKKALCIVVLMAVCIGLLFSLELKNSTFIGGVSYDYITAEGHSFVDNQPFTTKVAGLSVYGGYDVQIGSRWFSRLEYEYLMLPTTFSFKGDEVTKDDGVKRSGSKKRFGGYVVLDLKNKIKVNLGGVITNVTMGISYSDSDVSFEYVQDLVGIGLILEGQYDLNKHFTLRFGIVPDFTFATIDRLDISIRDADLSVHKNSETRSALFDVGFSISARMGISYKF